MGRKHRLSEMGITITTAKWFLAGRKWPLAIHTCSRSGDIYHARQTHTNRWRSYCMTLFPIWSAGMRFLLMRAITMSERKRRPEQNNKADGSHDNHKGGPKCSWLWTPCWLHLHEEMTPSPPPCYSLGHYHNVVSVRAKLSSELILKSSTSPCACANASDAAGRQWWTKQTPP